MSEKNKKIKIKICGVRRKADLDEIMRLGVDAVGYNFIRFSKRFFGDISIDNRFGENAQDSCLIKVGVFADDNLEGIVKTVSKHSLNIVQLHGEENIEYILRLREQLPQKVKIWKAVRIFSDEDLPLVDRYEQAIEVDAILLDTKVPGGPLGGTGATFDWSLVSRIHRLKSLILAGGLTPENIAEAIRQTRPDWVDVAGGVETAPGVKDPQKMRDFIAAVRRASPTD